LRRFASSLIGWVAVGTAVLACSSAPSQAMDTTWIDWLPRINGKLQGTLAPVAERPLAWSVDWRPADGGERTGELAVTGADMALRIGLTWDATGGVLRWKVTEGRLDLGAWVTALAKDPSLAAMLAGIDVNGEAGIRGEGSWAGGVTTGTLHVELAGVQVSNATDGWTLEGVTMTAGGAVADLLQGRVRVDLAVGTISTGRFGARNLTIKGTLVDGVRAEWTLAQVEIAGGWLRAAPFATDLAKPKLTVDLSLERVGLQDIAALVPDTLATARGRVNGAVRLSWSEADGVSLGAGYLSLDPSEVAQVTFQPNPGLLTGSLPAQILSYYPGLMKIETGESPIRASILDVQLSDGTNPDLPNVVVHLEGEPVNPAIKAPLVLTVNVRGPLGPLIKFGTDRRLSAGGRK
jgi:hypothetical protein